MTKEKKPIFEAYLEDNEVHIKLNINPSTPLVSFAFRMLNLEIDNALIGSQTPKKSPIIQKKDRIIV